jgi:hypothetical protein
MTMKHNQIKYYYGIRFIFLLGLGFIVGLLPNLVLANTQVQSGLNSEYRTAYLYRAQAGETPESIAFDFLKEAADKNKRQQFYAYNHIASHQITKKITQNQLFHLPVDWMYLKPVTAILLTVKGAVEVLHQGVSFPLTVVPEGAVIKTSQTGFALVEFPDRSVLTVSPNSTVKLTSIRRYAKSDIFNIKVDLEQGRVESQVKHLQHPAADYTVKSKRLSTAVRGTRFSVSDVPNAYATTEVLEGGVQLNSTDPAYQDRLTMVSNGLGAYVKDSVVSEPIKLLQAPQWSCPTINGLAIDQPLPIVVNQGAQSFKFNIYEEPSTAVSFSVEQLNQTAPDIQSITTTPILPAQLNEGVYTVQLSAIDQYGLQGFSSTQRIQIKNKPIDTENWLHWVKNSQTQSWVLRPLPNTHIKQVFCLT